MSNEELALKIKEGEADFLTDLWSQVEKLISHKAYSYFTRFPELCANTGVTVEDLYQVGFFALCEAVEAYDPKSGYTFTTYLKYPFMNQVNKLVNLRTSKTDPLDSSSSLDAPIGYDFSNDGSETLLAGLIEDPLADEALEILIDEDYNASLRLALDKAINSLPERRADIIKGRFFEGLPQGKLAEKHNISQSRVRTLERESLRALKRRQELKPFRDEIISSLEYQGGFGIWKSTGMSLQERIVTRLEDRHLL
jgi:RNA polymerase sigma factor, sigma-70 family